MIEQTGSMSHSIEELPDNRTDGGIEYEQCAGATAEQD
jgi:hypothetical protein